jgi:hypothetical protein
LTKKNRSREHIIHEALGGRRTVGNFLCCHCNNSTGSKWDAALVETGKPLDFIASLGEWHKAETSPDFDLRKKANRHETVSGNETHTMYRGGGDSVTSFDGRELKAHISWSSEAQMWRIFEGILRKYAIPREKWADARQAILPQLKADQVDDHSVFLQVPNRPVDVGLSLVKSMLALACAEGVPQSACSFILPYLRENDEYPPVFDNDWPVLPDDVLADLHCVAVSGSRETGILIGYAHLSHLKAMVSLAFPYVGPEIHAVYAINAKTCEEVSVSPNMERPRAVAVAMETASHIAGESLNSLVVVPEICGVSAPRTEFLSIGYKEAIRHRLVPLLRAWYIVDRTDFNQRVRWPLGLPLIGEDGYPY